MSAARIIGPGRAGGSLALALAAAGWDVAPVLGRADDLAGAASGVDVLLVATPDRVVAEVAGQVAPNETTVVAHVAGSLGLDVLAPHRLRASIHPLVTMPDASSGAERLRAGAWFGVAANAAEALAVAEGLVASLGGSSIPVGDEARTLYHAAACMASNHLVALLGQVERVASRVGVPLEAYLDLVRQSVENVAELGCVAALTGPISRGDDETVQRHLAALDAADRPAYEALADEARRLVTLRDGIGR